MEAKLDPKPRGMQIRGRLQNAAPTQYVTDQPTTVIVRTSNSSPKQTTLSAFP